MVIKTEQDWWNSFDQLYKLLPNMAYEFNWDLTAEATESGLKVDDGLGCSIYKYLKILQDNKDHEKLLTYLNIMWNVAPDQKWIHTVNGWSILCDLCSESWMFNELEE